MTTREYQRKIPLSEMQRDFESLIPIEASSLTASTEIEEPLRDWPDKAATELRMVYVTIEGSHIDDEGDFEAMTVTVADEKGQQRISDIELGRAD